MTKKKFWVERKRETASRTSQYNIPFPFSCTPRRETLSSWSRQLIDALNICHCNNNSNLTAKTTVCSRLKAFRSTFRSTFLIRTCLELNNRILHNSTKIRNCVKLSRSEDSK